MEIVIITTVSQSVQRLFPHMREDAHPLVIVMSVTRGPSVQAYVQLIDVKVPAYVVLTF